MSAPEGNAIGGETIGGEAVGGETVGGETIRGETIRGDAIRGDAIRGEAIRGETIGGEAAVADGASSLGRWSRRVVAALAEVVLPAGGDAPSVSIAEVVRFIDGYVPHMPRLLRLLFPVGLMLLELGAFVLAPSLVPFSAMSLGRRRAYVDGWVHARWRLRRDLIKAVKGLCLIAYYSDPRVGARLGYAVEEHVATVSAERLRRHAHDV